MVIKAGVIFIAALFFYSALLNKQGYNFTDGRKISAKIIGGSAYNYGGKGCEMNTDKLGKICANLAASHLCLSA